MRVKARCSTVIPKIRNDEAVRLRGTCNMTSAIIHIAAGVLVAAVLSGCTTLTTLVEHHDLQVSTRMSSSLFMNPVAQDDRTVYVQVQNTNDKGDFGLGSALSAMIQSQGWTVVTDPAKAQVILQIGVLQAGRIQVQTLQSALLKGYGSVLATAAVGAGAAALAGGSGTVIGGTALGLGTADYVGGLLVRNEIFSVIADVRVSQRGKPGQLFTVTNKTAIQNAPAENPGANPTPAGTATTAASAAPVVPTQPANGAVTSTITQSYTTQTEYQIQQTRVICFANRANLTWPEAMPAIRQGLANTLAGLF